MLNQFSRSEIIFGKEKISTGAESDISQTTDIALKMLSQYGMGETLGLIRLSENNPLYQCYGNNILTECKDLIDKLYEETLDLLNENRETLNKLSLTLLEEETLYEDSLKYILHST